MLTITTLVVGLCIAPRCLVLTQDVPTLGQVSGKTLQVFDKQVYAYLGIPYATSPTGALRFQEPQPIKSWNYIYNATEKPSSCLQDESFTSSEWLQRDPENISEDCLYMNLWIPTDNEDNKPLATMVWIHGGGFRIGSSSMVIYDGALLASMGNVIVASFNYRLGAFGYANFDHEEAGGNMGMLDQVMALKWIYQNIEAFGGDKDTITLFGESSGSVSIGHHLLSPLTRGLFARVIMQSGSNYNKITAVDPEINIRKTEIISKQLGCGGNESLNCMREMAGSDILSSEKSYTKSVQSITSFAPQKSDPYLPEDPLHAIDSGKFHQVDVLIGQVRDEASSILGLYKPELLLEDDPVLTKSEAKHILGRLFDTEGEALDRMEEEYLRSVEDDSSSMVKKTMKAVGDGLFTCPILHLAEKLSADDRKVYHYTFNHARIKSERKKWMGVPHFEDVFFVFGIPFVAEEDFTEEEREFSKKIIDMWTNFAKTGTPSLVNAEEEWKTFDPRDRNSLSLTLRSIRPVKAEVNEKCGFWMDLYKN